MKVEKGISVPPEKLYPCQRNSLLSLFEIGEMDYRKSFLSARENF
jgi:hypothetical protein